MRMAHLTSLLTPPSITTASTESCDGPMSEVTAYLQGVADAAAVFAGSMAPDVSSCVLSGIVYGTRAEEAPTERPSARSILVLSTIPAAARSTTGAPRRATLLFGSSPAERTGGSTLPYGFLRGSLLPALGHPQVWRGLENEPDSGVRLAIPLLSKEWYDLAAGNDDHGHAPRKKIA